MPFLLSDFVLFACLAAWVAGIVVAVASSQLAVVSTEGSSAEAPVMVAAWRVFF